jgi:hypothetical protein
MRPMPIPFCSGLSCFTAVVVAVAFLATTGQLPARGQTSRSTPHIEPARYPLKLVSPRESGTSPAEGSPAMPAGHRIFKAYPGLNYEIRAVTLGGAFPFRYALADAPSGMTVDPSTGLIRWPNPATGRVTPKLTVTDAAGTSITSAWTITVAADGYRFVDAEGGDDSHPGTREQPWKSLAAIREKGRPGEIVYFRTGTYATAGLPVSGGETWERVEFNGRAHPVQWLAYPGEKPTFDAGYRANGDSKSADAMIAAGQFIRFSGSSEAPVYLDGLAITRARHIGLQFTSGTCDYGVFRKLDIHGIAQSIDGGNSAGVMTLTQPGRPSFYTAFQDCDFHDNACGGIKQYSQRKLLWEDCRFRDSGNGPDLKADVARFEARGCLFSGNRGRQAGLFGNLHPARGGEITGEIRFNRMLCGGTSRLAGVPASSQLALDVNQDGLANEIHIYRNTLVGGVCVRNTDAADGPFHFTRNVIINDGEGQDRIALEAVSAPDRVRYQENLAASSGDNLIDAEGKLKGAYRNYVGTHGHETP